MAVSGSTNTDSWYSSSLIHQHNEQDGTHFADDSLRNIILSCKKTFSNLFQIPLICFPAGHVDKKISILSR